MTKDGFCIGESEAWLDEDRTPEELEVDEAEVEVEKNDVEESETEASDPKDEPKPASGLSLPRGLDYGVPKPFTKLTTKTWLRGRTINDVYRLLVEAYRLRMEDDYKMTGVHGTDIDCIHGSAPNIRISFRRFLEKAPLMPGVLPTWWCERRQHECEEFGMRDGWYMLWNVISIDTLVERYGDRDFPTHLRVFASQVLGTAPDGLHLNDILQAGAAAEALSSPGDPGIA